MFVGLLALAPRAAGLRAVAAACGRRPFCTSQTKGPSSTTQAGDQTQVFVAGPLSAKFGPAKQLNLVEHLNDKAIAQMATHDQLMVALSRTGHVYAYGRGNIVGEQESWSDVFSSSKDAAQFAQIVGGWDGGKPVHVACAQKVCFVLTDSGGLYSWGTQSSNALGYKHSSSMPKRISIAKDSPVKAIACGSTHALAVDKNNRIFSWGTSRSGALGPAFLFSQIHPEQLDLPMVKGEISQVACGSDYSAFITDGALYTWGSNEDFQLGYPTEDGFSSNSSIPGRVLFDLSEEEQRDVDREESHQITGQPRIAQVAPGRTHCLALTDDNKLYEWGMRTVPFPTLVEADFGKIVKIASGFGFSAILNDQGALFIRGSIPSTTPSLIGSVAAFQPEEPFLDPIQNRHIQFVSCSFDLSVIIS